jgi:hypothetical protein
MDPLVLAGFCGLAFEITTQKLNVRQSGTARFPDLSPVRKLERLPPSLPGRPAEKFKLVGLRQLFNLPSARPITLLFQDELYRP